MSIAASLLELRDVHTYYGQIHALKGVSLTVNEGEIVTLIGSNGAGKSTTLRTISGLLRPRRGDVRLQGQSMAAIPPHKIVQSGIGHVPEGRGVFPALTVLENLEMGAYLLSDHSEFENRISNVFTYRIVNKTSNDMADLQIKLLSHNGEIVKVGKQQLSLKGEGMIRGTMFIKIAEKELQGDKTELEIGLYRDGQLLETTYTNFLSPRTFN